MAADCFRDAGSIAMALFISTTCCQMSALAVIKLGGVRGERICCRLKYSLPNNFIKIKLIHTAE